MWSALRWSRPTSRCCSSSATGCTRCASRSRPRSWTSRPGSCAWPTAGGRCSSTGGSPRTCTSGSHDVVDEAGAPVDHLVVMRRLPADRRLATMVADPRFDEAHLAAVARQRGRVPLPGRARAGHRPGGLGRAPDDALVDQPRGDRSRSLGGSSTATCSTGSADRRWPTSTADTRCSPTGSPSGGSSTGTVTCSPRTSSASTTAPGSSTASSSTPGSAGVTCSTTPAFLAMDLEHLGRPDLARRFLAAYREYAGENHPDSLEHWYIAYRALVRAKIACLRADAGAAGCRPRRRRGSWPRPAATSTRPRSTWSSSAACPAPARPRSPRGWPTDFGWALLRSDEVRKELAGLSPLEPAGAAPFEGIYTPAFTAEVYGELLRRAELALGWGDSVVLDATWLDPEQRDAASALGPGGATPTSTSSAATCPSTRPATGSSPGRGRWRRIRRHARGARAPGSRRPARPGPEPRASTPAARPPTSSTTPAGSCDPCARRDRGRPRSAGQEVQLREPAGQVGDPCGRGALRLSGGEIGPPSRQRSA